MSVDTDARRALNSIAHAPACPPGYGYLWRKGVRRHATASVRRSPYSLACKFVPDEQARPQDPQTKTGSVYVWPDPPAVTPPDQYPLIPTVYRPDPAIVAALEPVEIPAPPPAPILSKNVAYLQAEADSPSGRTFLLPERTSSVAHYRRKFQQATMQVMDGTRIYATFPGTEAATLPAECYVSPPAQSRTRVRRERVPSPEVAHLYLFRYVLVPQTPSALRPLLRADLFASSARYLALPLPLRDEHLHPAFFQYAVQEVRLHADTDTPPKLGTDGRFLPLPVLTDPRNPASVPSMTEQGDPR